MSGDYSSTVDTIRTCLGSIGRLGRAADVHLALAAQRAGMAVSTDLLNNIHLKLLLGQFDFVQGIFDRDISHLSKPHIKGRGLLVYGNEYIEVQTYYTDPADYWEFDLTRKDTYNNPIFIEQCNKRGIPINDTGWVEQKCLNINEAVEEPSNKKERKKSLFFEDEDDDFNEGKLEEFIAKMEQAEEKKEEESKGFTFSFGGGNNVQEGTEN
jgi:hypothetical protein